MKLQAIVERVEAQRLSRLINQHLQRKMPQRSAEPTERTAGRTIRIDGQPFETCVRTGVEVESALPGAAGHPHP